MTATRQPLELSHLVRLPLCEQLELGIDPDGPDAFPAADRELELGEMLAGQEADEVGGLSRS